MQQHIDYEKAIQMVNAQLKKMKAEMDEVEEMGLSGAKKQLAKYMKRIYKRLEEMTDVYTQTHEDRDFNSVCRELEALKPSFVLNYNEICYDGGLDQLNNTLSEMEEELDTVDGMGLSGAQEEKVKEMHGIYDAIYDTVDKYAHSHDHEDFESAVHQVETLKPEFILNYNTLTD